MFTKINNLPQEGSKTALVIRFGAWGDMVLVSSVIRKLHEDGYHVTVNCTERGYAVVKHDPNVGRFVVMKDGELNYDALVGQFWPELGKSFSRVVNLTHSVECTLAITPGTIDPVSGDDMYLWPPEKLSPRCNVNYMDRTMELAGYPDCKGVNGQLFFTEKEEAWAKAFKAKHPGFLIVWALGGSAAHKAYPYAEIVANVVLDDYKDIQIVTVGDDWCKLLEFDEHPRVVRKSGEFGIRKSMILTKYADLVIGPDSSVVNAASCFDTPKIVLLSSASAENLTKYWHNTISLSTNVPCFPCHKIHYQLDCPLVPEIKAPVCMGKLDPRGVVMAIDGIYKKYKDKQLSGVS